MSEADQAKMAFFYENGYDDMPPESEGFHMPPQRANAPSDWSIYTYNSNICTNNDADSLENPNCEIVKCIASGSISNGADPNDDTFYTAEVIRNPDESVTITDWKVRLNKMFHPKTKANWHIAQAASDAFRRN